jgi:hypothetical protein
MHVVSPPAKSGIQEQKTTITSATGQLLTLHSTFLSLVYHTMIMEHGDGMDHGRMSHDHGSHDMPMPMPMPGGSCSVSQPSLPALLSPPCVLELTTDEHALEQRYQRCMCSIRIMAYLRSILNGSLMVSISSSCNDCKELMNSLVIIAISIIYAYILSSLRRLDRSIAHSFLTTSAPAAGRRESIYPSGDSRRTSSLIPPIPNSYGVVESQGKLGV